MNKIKILLSGLFLVSASAVMAQGAKNIRINEVLTNNTASIQDEYGQREAWIEVENTSFTTYNIRGMYFTTDRNVLDPKMSVPERIKRMIVIPSGDVRTQIGGRQHLVFFCNSNPAQGKLHLSLKVPMSEPLWIGFYNGNATELIDSVITLLAMGIVFFCLAVLFLFFWLFGLIMAHLDTAKKVAHTQPIKPITKTVEVTHDLAHVTGNILQDGLKTKGIDKEVYIAVISMALKQYQDDVHDVESGIITIKSHQTGWADEGSQMTHFSKPMIPTSHKAPKIPTTPEIR